VMSNAAANLASSVCLLEFMTKAPKFMWSDKLVGRGLLAREYCSAIGPRFCLNDKYILYLFGQTRRPLAVSRA